METESVILEIRAGTGGIEAGLFAANLYRMYSRFANSKGWKFLELSRSKGGLGDLNKVIAKISGSRTFDLLKNESGVHRVQRIPKTEKSGRVHTSTATVAVLPAVSYQPSAISLNPKDLKIETFRASAPGGQHMQKTESAVRITHLPTKISVECQDERSQYQNKEKALKILRSKLEKKFKKQQESKIAKLRAEQVQTAERAEKIRTYNFPQNRVTDHRIGKNFYQLDKILDGDLNIILKHAKPRPNLN